MSYGQYSLVPGTNELIRKHPDQGRELFKRHGFDIFHPNHRDYYNGLRYGGMGFFQDLASILAGVLGPKSAGGAQAAAYRSPYSLTAANPSDLNYDSSAGVRDLASMPLGTTIGFYGDATDYGTSSMTGHDKDKANHVRAYHELLHHLERESERTIYPFPYPYPVVVQELQQSYPPVQPPQYNELPQMPIESHTIFGINKKIFFGLVIVAVVVLYLKFRK